MYTRERNTRQRHDSHEINRGGVESKPVGRRLRTEKQHRRSGAKKQTNEIASPQNDEINLKKKTNSNLNELKLKWILNEF